jgi:hypothetical protein
MTTRGVCAVTLAGLALAACAGSPTGPATGRAAPTAPADAGGAAADPSYDWHGLVRIPFGTTLAAAPLPLHEVLLFHDSGQEAADARDCYGIDGPGPRFLGAPADQYVLCFEHDRLTRVDASVQLPPADAAAIFARACDLWRERAIAGGPPRSGGDCAGRDAGVAFVARLAGGADEPPGRASMTLTAIAGP